MTWGAAFALAGCAGADCAEAGPATAPRATNETTAAALVARRASETIGRARAAEPAGAPRPCLIVVMLIPLMPEATGRKGRTAGVALALTSQAVVHFEEGRRWDSRFRRFAGRL